MTRLLTMSAFAIALSGCVGLNQAPKEIVRDNAMTPSQIGVPTRLRLHKTTRTQAQNWLSERGIRCSAGIANPKTIRCHDVAPESLGISSDTRIAEIALFFGADNRLSSVSLRDGNRVAKLLPKRSNPS